jgi:hypothetical protein
MKPCNVRFEYELSLQSHDFKDYTYCLALSIERLKKKKNLGRRQWLKPVILAT